MIRFRDLARTIGLGCEGEACTAAATLRSMQVYSIVVHVTVPSGTTFT